MFYYLMSHLSAFCIFLCLVFETDVIDALFTRKPKAERSLEFADLRPGKYLSGSLIKTSFIVNKNRCSMECTREPICRSFNFCGRQKCELNRDDVFSIELQNQELLETRENCAYHGMKREHIPECDEQTLAKNIQDPSPGFCQIGGKRVDREWSSWEEKINSSSVEYVVYNQREKLVDFAHGGKIGEEDSIHVTTKFILVTAKKSWWQAKSNCDKLGGHLFSNLDGSTSQLRGIVSLLGHVVYS